MGTLPAPKLCKDLGIKNQTQRKKLDKAKKEKVQPTNVQNASSQFDDLFNN